jgi:hypothetical protein
MIRTSSYKSGPADRDVHNPNKGSFSMAFL